MKRGNQVNELCISSRMRILNGRTLRDYFGKFTCQKPTGASVADYMLASEELLKNVIFISMCILFSVYFLIVTVNFSLY